MKQWIIEGIRTGIKTTKYPKKFDTSPGISPSRPILTQSSKIDPSICPTGAIKKKGKSYYIDYSRCIYCYRCKDDRGGSLNWEDGYEWAYFTKKGQGPLKSSFRSSTHILVVDTGSCGACLSEVELLNNPYYNMHRLGFFVTPSPRKADILMVVGPVTHHMELALKKAFDAMPTPKRVMAVGTCAISGGIFTPSFITASSVSEVIPVDLEVPGDPPPPLAILYGLLILSGKMQPKE